MWVGMLDRHPHLQLIAPSASPEEAAAIVAALARFMRDTASASSAATQAPQDAWHSTAILEGVSRDPWVAASDAWLGAPGHTSG
jgi:hypothetical protein